MPHTHARTHSHHHTHTLTYKHTHTHTHTHTLIEYKAENGCLIMLTFSLFHSWHFIYIYCSYQIINNIGFMLSYLNPRMKLRSVSLDSKCYDVKVSPEPEQMTSECKRWCHNSYLARALAYHWTTGTLLRAVVWNVTVCMRFHLLYVAYILPILCGFDTFVT